MGQPVPDESMSAAAETASAQLDGTNSKVADSRNHAWLRAVLVFVCVLVPSLCMWMYVFPGFLQPDHAMTIAYLATGTYDAWHSVFWALLAKPLLYDSPSYGWYGLAQLLVYAGAITFSIVRLRKLDVVRTAGMWVLVAVFALSPCFVLYNVTYSSDIVFATLLVPYTVLLVELAVTRLESLKRPGFLAGLMVMTFVLLELRKNALLIPLVLLVVLLIVRRDLWKRILTGVLVPVVAFLGVNAVFDAVFDVQKSPSQELMSVPAMQVARVYAAGLQVPGDVDAYFTSIRPAEEWKGNYGDGRSADSEKQGLELTPEFIRNWAELGARYPTVYTSAYWTLMKHFFTMDPAPTVALDFSAYPQFTTIPCKSLCKTEYEQQMTAPQTERQSEVLQWFTRLFGTPVLMQTIGRLFFNTALPFWTLLAVFLVLMFRKKRKRLLIALVPMASLFLAFLCFSPIVLIRYAMEIYYMVPVLVAVAVSRVPLAMSPRGAGKPSSVAKSGMPASSARLTEENKAEERKAEK